MTQVESALAFERLIERLAQTMATCEAQDMVHAAATFVGQLFIAAPEEMYAIYHDIGALPTDETFDGWVQDTLKYIREARCA